MNKNMTFEAAMDKLEEIVARLEAGNEPLDALLKLYEAAAKLSNFCYGKLENAEQKIRQISELEGEGKQDE